MSIYRVEDGSSFCGAYRPWNEPTSKGYRKVPESEAARRERETCLACPLPECRPGHTACGLTKAGAGSGKYKGGRKKLEPPPVFVKYGMNSTSTAEWAEHLGVSKSTINRWRRELGYQRMRIDRRTKP